MQKKSINLGKVFLVIIIFILIYLVGKNIYNKKLNPEKLVFGKKIETEQNIKNELKNLGFEKTDVNIIENEKSNYISYTINVTEEDILYSIDIFDVIIEKERKANIIFKVISENNTDLDLKNINANKEIVTKINNYLIKKKYLDKKINLYQYFEEASLKEDAYTNSDGIATVNYNKDDATIKIQAIQKEDKTFEHSYEVMFMDKVY